MLIKVIKHRTLYTDSQEERDNEDLPEPGDANEQMHESARQEDISETPVFEQQVIAPELNDNLSA